MTMFKVLRRNEDGAAALEFAIALPVLMMMIIGIFQVGLLFEANAGMQHALGEGARLATLCVPSGSTCTAPSDTTVKTRISARLFGKNDGTFTVADPAAGAGFKTLSVSYTRTMHFLFITGPTVTLTRSKKVYTVS
jgi:Flp pilus assembly protein TadG